MTLGAEYRRQRYSAEVQGLTNMITTPDTLSRGMRAAFTQLEAPLVKGDSSVERIGRVDLSMSARFESFGNYGSDFAPQIGLSWVPTSSLKFTGIWARWYHPPDLPDLSEATNLSALVALPDSHGGFSEVLAVNGNNAALRPE